MFVVKYNLVIDMIYVMSDIHGCYDEYIKLLDLIHFNDNDILYVLGDVIDRGPYSIKVLQHMMMYSNIIPIIGNHEYMAIIVLKKLCVEIDDSNIEDYLSEDDMMNYMNWCLDGGYKTIEEFRKLSLEEKEDILDYLSEFSLYEEVNVNGKDYLLVHAGLEPFNNKKNIDDYELSEIIFKAPDYNQKYYEDKYVIHGHKPTMNKIIHKNNHIGIDCGCVFGSSLAVLCLDTLEEWYVKKDVL